MSFLNHPLLQGPRRVERRVAPTLTPVVHLTPEEASGRRLRPLTHEEKERLLARRN